MDPRAALQQYFGFDDFRPGQEAAVEAAMAGRDVLVVMPTGAGKSLCYQLPALCRDDLTLVVSPLVALMQDQVEALERIAPGKVGLVNAQADAATNRATLEAAQRGELRALYVAPERFSNRAFLDAMQQTKVGLFVVDEAHCVSQWGHDFRPDYFRLADAARWLGADAIVASTATATPEVAKDIEARLGLDDPAYVTTGFDRPNLSFGIARCNTTKDKERRILAALQEDGATPAIVYAGTRKNTDKLAEQLDAALGVKVEGYHAGLDRDRRAEVQRRFMSGETDVVVATNAFGMGIDKADVRTVCHASVPASVEAWYQEAGRAGRDGDPGRALLFAEAKDKSLHVFFIQRAEVDDQGIDKVAHRLFSRAEGNRYDLGVDELSYLVTDDGDGSDQVRAIVGHLARAGVLRPAPSTPDRLRGRLEAAYDGKARALCRRSAGEAQNARWKQYRAVWALVEEQTCRRAALLDHFGDPAAGAPAPGVPCCDVCDPSWMPAVALNAAQRSGAVPADLDDAIISVVRRAEPAVGRTRAVEILRGGRSKVVQKYSYDGLPEYGAFDHLRSEEVLARVDALLDGGSLRSTGGAYPKLEAAQAQGLL
ncbi:MAG: RecQ family ATP-dependent DNA helicase [Solirubrobacteraceae bacterium]|nr:RecQ family ATP-dependent DNA helicase [Solirubrobacteraceae bacterium]